MKILHMKIGSKIRKIRKLLELSQDAVIKNCKLKISQTTLSKIENDNITVDLSSARCLDIANAMGVSLEMIENYDNSLKYAGNSQSSSHLPAIIDAGQMEEIRQSINNLQEIQKKQQEIIDRILGAALR